MSEPKKRLRTPPPPPIPRRRKGKAKRAKEARQVVEDIEELAAEQRGHGRTQPMAAKLQRDMTLYQAHMRGVTTADLAQAFELDPSTVYRIVKEQRREYRRLNTMSPVEIVEELTDQIDAGISEIATVATKETGSTRVTAVLGRINALIAKGKWLQQAGIIPQTPQELRVQVDGMNMAANVIAVLEKRGLLTPELMAEIHEGIGGETIDGTAEEVPALPTGE